MPRPSHALALLAASLALLLGPHSLAAQALGDVPGKAASGDSLTLSLGEAVARARAEGPHAEIARLGFQEARFNNHALRTTYWPSFQLTGSVPGLERSIDQIQLDDGSFDYREQNRLFSEATLRAEQPVPYTGGSVYLSSRLGRLDLFGDRAFSRWNAAPVVVGLQQPLFQYNPLKWNRRLAPLRFESTRRTLTASVAEGAEETAAAFFEVYIARINLEIADANVAVNDTIYTLSQGRYEIGRIAENDVLQSELQLLNARSSRSEARTAYRRAQQNLRTLLDVPAGTPLAITPPTDLPPGRVVDPEEAVARAEKRRPAFLNLRLRRLEAERAVAQAEGQSGFSAEIVAEYGLNQQAGTFGEAYRDPLGQQRFGVSLQVPLWQNGRSEAAVEAAETNREQVARQTELEREELRQEVYFEAVELRQLRRQVDIAAQADTVARRRFRVARKRYEVGNISITDLFNAQREKDVARRDYIQTLRQFWTSYYRLRRLTLYDVAADRPLEAKPAP